MGKNFSALTCYKQQQFDLQLDTQGDTQCLSE